MSATEPEDDADEGEDGGGGVEEDVVLDHFPVFGGEAAGGFEVFPGIALGFALVHDVLQGGDAAGDGGCEGEGADEDHPSTGDAEGGEVTAEAEQLDEQAHGKQREGKMNEDGVVIGNDKSMHDVLLACPTPLQHSSTDQAMSICEEPKS